MLCLIYYVRQYDNIVYLLSGNVRGVLSYVLNHYSYIYENNY